MRPSTNHKKRSALRQAGEEQPAPPPPAPVEPPPPAPPSDTPPYMRKFRMKRSGQMHDDLTGPMPEDKAPPPRESEY